MSTSRHNDSDEEQPLGISICIARSYFDTYVVESRTLDELQTLLAFLRLQAELPSGDSSVEEEAILGDDRLNMLLGTTAVAQSSTSRIIRALNDAVSRGALLRSTSRSGSKHVVRYSTPEGMPSATHSRSPRVGSNSASAAGLVQADEHAASVYAAYEANIGMLTPLVADQIRLALELYPDSWIHEAITEAVAYNRRQWRYIQRILQNWREDGRTSGPANEVSHATHKRSPAGALDTDQYRKGRHLERARKS